MQKSSALQMHHEPNLVRRASRQTKVNMQQKMIKMMVKALKIKKMTTRMMPCTT